MVHSLLKYVPVKLVFYNNQHNKTNSSALLDFKVTTPKRTFYLTGETTEVVDDWLRGNTISLEILFYSCMMVCSAKVQLSSFHMTLFNLFNITYFIDSLCLLFSSGIGLYTSIYILVLAHCNVHWFVSLLKVLFFFLSSP